MEIISGHIFLLDRVCYKYMNKCPQAQGLTKTLISFLKDTLDTIQIL